MEESISLVDRMKPYQYLQDIISYKIEEELIKKRQQMAPTNYDSYDYNNYGFNSYDYNTSGINPTNFNLKLKQEWFNPKNTELRKKLEENLPEECFIRDEDGNLKKVTKAEAIEFELKSCIVEDKYTNPLGNGIIDKISRKDQLYNQLTEEAFKRALISNPLNLEETQYENINPREYVMYTNQLGLERFNHAIQDYANNWSGLTTLNHL